MSTREAGSMPENDQDPLNGIDLSDTGYDQLTQQQKNEFIHRMKMVIDSNTFTYEALNNKDSLRAAVDQIKKRFPSDVHDPSPVAWSSPSSRPQSNIKRPLTNTDKLLIALGVGGAVVAGVATVGASISAYSGAYQGALSEPTPAVRDDDGSSTFNSPRAQREVTDIDGGFTAFRRSDGKLELTSTEGNIPTKLTFMEGDQDTMTANSFTPIPGTQNVYFIDTSTLGSGPVTMRVTYFDRSNEQVFETDPVQVRQ